MALSEQKLTNNLSAVLLDRDGVINRELGRAVRSWEEFEFLPGALAALRQLALLPVPILVISNQSAIGRGWMSLEAVEGIHCRMLSAIQAAGGRIDEVAICPHAPETGCPCRKPRPGLLLETARKHGFDVSRAVLVGDAHRDVQAAQAAGAMPILVRSGHPIPLALERQLRRERVPVLPDLVGVAQALVTGVLV
jgi:D-glycero-D-manno-heptose 1,7-bisphosphate phosphatase